VFGTVEEAIEGSYELLDDWDKAQASSRGVFDQLMAQFKGDQPYGLEIVNKGHVNQNTEGDV
jgi:hypothetical protein